MTAIPQVLVLAPYHGQAGADRIAESLARQTWRGAKLLFITSRGADGATASVDTCPVNALAERLSQSAADYVFHWPATGDLRETALETLVLSLHLSPDQHGVTDASRGQGGLLLMRPSVETAGLASLWIESPGEASAEIQRRELAFYHLDETLTTAPARLSADLGGAEKIFQPLSNDSSHWHYELIEEAPLWPVPVLEPDPQHILFLAAELPLGGSSKFLLDVVAQLKATGHRVTVVTTAGKPNPWLGELLRITSDFFTLSHARAHELPRLVRHLALTRNCGRIVNSDSLFGYHLLPWLRGQLPGVTFVDYVHIEWPYGWFAQRSTHWQSQLDLTMVSSEHLRGWMIERGAAPEKIRVCYTNIDAEKWKPDASVRASERSVLGVEEGVPLILYPCRIDKQKRPEFFGNIGAELRQVTSAPFRVVVAGDGPLMPALRRFVERQGLEAHITLLGAVSLERVARLHAAADILLLPSLSEGIALALFEAMALESVPVVSDVGGQRELVTPECGHLIRIGEPACEIPEYVMALKRLIEDPAHRQRLAAAARARVEKYFPLSDMTTRFLAALEAADELRRLGTVLPMDAALAREIAAIAAERVRGNRLGAQAQDFHSGMSDLLVRREKTIAKLQRQVDQLRAEMQNAEAYAPVA